MGGIDGIDAAVPIKTVKTGAHRIAYGLSTKKSCPTKISACRLARCTMVDRSGSEVIIISRSHRLYEAAYC